MPTNSGKNLFNVKEYVELEKDLFATGTYELTDEGHLQVNRTDSRVWERSSFEYKIYLKPGTDYTFSSGEALNWRIYAFNKNGRPETIQSKGNIVSFKTSGNIEFITIKFFPVDMNYPVIVPDLQLEEGSVATEYEPWTPTPEGHIFDLSGKELYVGDKQVRDIYLNTKRIRLLKPERYSPSLISPEAQLHEFDYMSPHGAKLPDTVHTGTYGPDGYRQDSFQMNLNGTTGVTSRPRVGNTIVYEYILSRKARSSLSSIMYLDYNLSSAEIINIFQDSRTVKGGYAFKNQAYGEPTVSLPSKDKFFIIHVIQRVTSSSNTNVIFYINGRRVTSGDIGVTSGVGFQRPFINGSGSQSTGVMTEMKYSSRYNTALKEVAAYDFGGIYTDSYTSLINTNYERAKELYN